MTKKKCLLTSATGECADLITYAGPLMERYAARHGYDLRVNREEPEDPTGERRAKITLLREALPDYELVVWVDADVLITKFDEDIADDVPAFAFQAFVLEHSDWGFGPNSGVWAMRNDPESFQFLDELDLIGPHPAKPNSDQVIIHLALGWKLDEPATTARPAYHSPFLERTGWLPVKWNPVGYAYHEPASFRHYYAQSYERKLEQMRAAFEQLEQQGSIEPASGGETLGTTTSTS